MILKKYENKIIIVVLIISFIGSLSMMYLFMYHKRIISTEYALDTDAVGDYGSFVGGVIGTLLSILLLYLTFRLQREDSKKNSQVYENQILNDEFFHLLELYKDIADRFEYYNSESAEYNKGKDALKSLLGQMYENYNANVKFNQRRKVAQFEYMNIMHSYYETGAVYYRTIYRIFQVIDEACCDKKKKVEYAKIMRAQLTGAELVMLRYNAMTLYGEKSKQYLNKYNILKHIQPFDLLEMKKWRICLNKQDISMANMTLQNIRFLAKELIEDKTEKLCLQMKDKRYKLILDTNETRNRLIVTVSIDNSFVAPKYSQMLWLDNYMPEELEDMMYFFIFDTVCLSNFNKYNRRTDLHFHHENRKDSDGTTVIIVSVENKKGYPIKLSN